MHKKRSFFFLGGGGELMRKQQDINFACHRRERPITPRFLF